MAAMAAARPRAPALRSANEELQAVFVKTNLVTYRAEDDDYLQLLARQLTLDDSKVQVLQLFNPTVLGCLSPTGLRALFHCLVHSKVHTLEFFRSCFHPAGGCLSQLHVALNQIKRLDFKQCRGWRKDNNLSLLASALKVANGLQELHIHCDEEERLGDEACVLLCSALVENQETNHHFKMLDLQSFDLKEACSGAALSDLVFSARDDTCCRLQTLVLDKSLSTDIPLVFFCRQGGSGNNNGGVCELRLRYNNLTDPSAMALADFVLKKKGSQSLQCLNLTGNPQIGLAGWQALIRALLCSDDTLVDLGVRETVSLPWPLRCQMEGVALQNRRFQTMRLSNYVSSPNVLPTIFAALSNRPTLVYQALHTFDVNTYLLPKKEEETTEEEKDAEEASVQEEDNGKAAVLQEATVEQQNVEDAAVL